MILEARIFKELRNIDRFHVYGPTPFQRRGPPNFREGTHLFSSGPPLPRSEATNDVNLASQRRIWLCPKKGQAFVCRLKSKGWPSRGIQYGPPRGSNPVVDIPWFILGLLSQGSRYCQSSKFDPFHPLTRFHQLFQRPYTFSWLNAQKKEIVKTVERRLDPLLKGRSPKMATS